MTRFASQATGPSSVEIPLVLCCPACKGELRELHEEYRCEGCNRPYPVIGGIPDLRLFPDPYISFQDEYQKAGVLVEAATRHDFEGLVRLYWNITPDVPAGLKERYVRYALTAEDRGRAVLEEIDAQSRTRAVGEWCLELGCGTAGFPVAARSRFQEVVGIDIALRWLIIGKKRLEASGNPARLVCCNAEHLPFRDAVFDCVVGIHMLEHTQDRRRVVTEAGRVLRGNGVYFFSTPNRFSLTPEPCVCVWGVGFLPRPLAGPYVRLVKGVPYRHVRLMSAWELRRLFANPLFSRSAVSLPRISPAEQHMLSPGMKVLVSIYHALRRIPVISALMRLCAPLLQVTGRKRCIPLNGAQASARSWRSEDFGDD